MEGFAGVFFVAGGAFVSFLADAEFGGDVLAIRGGEDGPDAKEGEDVLFALDILRGDLESKEDLTGAPGVEPLGVEIVDDLGEGNQDGAAVFEDRKLAGLYSGGSSLGGAGDGSAGLWRRAWK